jgi:hypothetical protein
LSLDIFSSGCPSKVLVSTLPMGEELLFRSLDLLQRLGVWLSVVAWLTVAFGATTMAYVLRKVNKPAVWRYASVFGILALSANLADYFVTLHRSPDLRWEANPLWRNVVDRFGLTTAKWYGITGKIFGSVLAGQMVAFYLINRKLLFPVQPCSPLEFLARMGSRAHTFRERLLGLFTMFAFFFAGINLLYFYIAYLNWVDDPEAFAYLPSIPVSLLLLVSTLAALFAALTYRAFRHSLVAKSE